MEANETRELVTRFENGKKITDFELGVLLGIFSTLVRTLNGLPEEWHTKGLTEARVILTRLERLQTRRKKKDDDGTELYSGA